MTRSRFTVASALRLETRLGGIGNPRWLALLDHLDDSRSITAAAKAAGLSYKAAWDAIDSMNNLAGKPVVATSVGGKGGGGAKLTAQGRQLLATYREIESENARFVAGLNSRFGAAGRNLQALGVLSMRTSARNQWSGKVARVRHGAVNDEVELKLAGGDRIVAVITCESTENLGLKAGGQAIALVKSSSVMIALGARGTLRLSARNQLTGTIARITPGAVNTDVVIELRGGKTVAAIITNAAARELKLLVGRKATAVFKASAVLLGVT